MKTKLSEKIIELRALNYSYNKIVSLLGCSKSIISYYVGKDQKEKSKLRGRNYRKNNILGKKIYRFCSKYEVRDQKLNINKNIKRILFSKIRKFGDYKPMFTPQQLLDKIGDNPTCYLTGRPINIADSQSYHLDHIIPKSRGGDNTIDNCGIACSIANLSKSHMTYEEYVLLCKEVIKHYEVAHTGNAPVSQP
jgi:5-methylcytosine-specific restriction endonuclease McrA